MRKRILIVSTNAQVRTTAENTLRQQGFEVVSVDSAQRAEGILGVSDFDMTLVGYGAQDDSGGFYFDHWFRDPSYQDRTFLILSDTGAAPMGIPQELVIPPNAAPSDLVGIISQRFEALQSENPVFDGATNDEVDSVLDNAFGLDQIEVQDSATMGKETSEIINKKKSESLVGYEADITSISATQRNVTDTQKIDLAMAMNKVQKTQPDSSALPVEERLNIASHKFSAEQPPPEHVAQQPQQSPAPSAPEAPQTAPNEFMEMMREDLSTANSNQDANNPADESVFEWGAPAPNAVDVSQVFSQQMAAEIAERVSQKLVSQLNSDKFIQLIQIEIQNYLKNKS